MLAILPFSPDKSPHWPANWHLGERAWWWGTLAFTGGQSDNPIAYPPLVKTNDVIGIGPTHSDDEMVTYCAKLDL